MKLKTLRTPARTLRGAMHAALKHFDPPDVAQIDVWVEGGLIVRVRAHAQYHYPCFEIHRPGGATDDDIGLVRRALTPLTSGWDLTALLVCVHFPPVSDSASPVEPLAGRCYVLAP